MRQPTLSSSIPAIVSVLLMGSVQILFPHATVGQMPFSEMNSERSGRLRSSEEFTDNPSMQLAFGKERCRALAVNHADHYDFETKEHEGPGYIHVAVMQKGIDVTLTLSGPDGLAISRDWPNGRYGLESLSLDLKPGKYTLKVVGTDAATKEGAEYCLRAESKLGSSPEDAKRIQAEVSYATALGLLGKVRSPNDMVAAVKELKAAAHLWQNADNYGYATALTTYGYYAAFYTSLLSRDDALRIFNETLSLWRNIGDIRRQAQAFHNVGQVYDRYNQINEADNQYSEALKLWRLPETPKVPLEEATTLNNLATIRQQEGNYSDAIELLDLAIRKLEAGHNRRNEATSRNNLGHVFLDLGEYAMADECFKRAQEIRGKPEFDPGGWASTLQNWGLSRAFQRDFARAKELLAEGLEIRTQTRDPRLHETRYSQGFVSNMQGDSDGALSIFEKEILPEVENKPVQKVITLTSIGSIYRLKGDKQRALQIFRDAFSISSSVTNSSVVSLALFDLGRAEMELDFLDSAAAHLKQAIDLIEERRTRVINPEWQATYSASTRDVYETYIELLIRLHKPAEALEYSERARARALVDLLLEAKVNAFQEPENRERMKEFRAVQSELEALQTRLQGLEFLGVPETGKADLKKRIDELSFRLRRSDAAMKANSKGYRALHPEPLKLSDIQELLEGDTVLLEFLLGNEKSHLWVLGKTGAPVVVTLPSRAEIEAASFRVYGLLTTRDYNNPIRPGNRLPDNLPADPVTADKAYQAIAAEFGRTLLGDVTNVITGKRLLIVPDGALALIPFGALPSQDSNARSSETRWSPLLSEHVIVNLPSATALAVQREVFGASSSATKTLAVLADPVFDSNDEPHRCEKQRKDRGRTSMTVDDSRSRSATLERALSRPISFDVQVKLPRLKVTQQEMNAILQIPFKGEKISACGFDANYDVATNKLSDFRFLHFATHGVVNTEHPELSGIVLSLVDRKGRYTPEGFLRLTEIYELRLQADVIVLSACYTALGREVKGEGPISLTRGFMHAGARRVIASLWQVKDQSTSELMKYFYEGMFGNENLPAATALQRAQMRVIQNHPDWPPFFWAAFIAQGEYR